MSSMTESSVSLVDCDDADADDVEGVGGGDGAADVEGVAEVDGIVKSDTDTLLSDCST